MPEKRVRAAALTCLLLTAAACSADGDGSDEPGMGRGSRTTEPTEIADIRPEPALTVDCLHAIGEQPAPTSSTTVFLGDVALETGRRLQAARAGGAEYPHPLFAKSGLMVRDGAVVDIEVVPAPGNGTSIGWGNGHPSAGAVRVPGCTTGSAETSWVTFSGGYYVDRPGCVTLVVRSRGSQTKVHVPVGADCRVEHSADPTRGSSDRLETRPPPLGSRPAKPLVPSV
ncbi:hypothetical protein [Embleya scabrispora]|uniref:hypothetical protein n=1 Tax=Embleya scabrispora TaxID=159449 RepID=UPI00037E082E|nr:hypothetical protein [Embleya scabrispora]MYS79059.1 hypothetical protein [Streptomyces sp. SID5474]